MTASKVECTPLGAGGFRLIETELPGVCVIEPRLIRDERGFFMETYHQAKLASLGIHESFVQDNHSRSRRGTLRGLHYQLRFPQTKLCRVIEGEVLDVAVDIRRGSPFFGRWVAVQLSAANHRQVLIPAGFAHGFLVLSEFAQFLYKCSEFYRPEDEHGVLWNDPDLQIPWNIKEPLLSEKDSAYLPLAKLPAELLPAYSP